MPDYLIRRVIIFGSIAIFGVLFIQSFWLCRVFSLKDSEFNQTVTIALLEVAQQLADFNQTNLPKHQLIQRKSTNYYAVNINDQIDPNVLEDYLIREFTKKGINVNFEYAVYDCLSQELVYGNYCQMDNLVENRKALTDLPKFENLTYYFVVRFPSMNAFLLSSMGQNILFSFITFLALAFFIYSIWIILKQKRLSEFQKDFINNMTHEFKTPISSIKIASDFLLRNDVVQTEPRLKRYAEIINQQNERLNTQVENVLSLAKMESNNFKLNKKRFDIIPVIQELSSSYNVKLEKGRIEFKHSNTTAFIYADKLHFTNVVSNMLDNAIKYCKKAPHVILKLSEETNKFTLQVSDNGIGIDKDDFDKLFDKFYRVSTGDVHDVKGFGLGLFYVSNICQAHDWTIEVESEVGQGTTFTIIIPKEKTYE